MFQRLVSHNEDIRRLVEKGFAVAFDAGYLIIRDVPYLDAELRLKVGAIVTKLDFVDQDHVRQTDHQIWFAGAVPHGLDGKPIPNLGGGATTLALGEASTDITVERSFSNKPRPTGVFVDFFEKIESYVGIIAGPAMELHGASPYTFRATKEVAGDTVFKFYDTLSSRAEINDLSAKLKNDVVAVIGLGGTGSYLLDYLVKTPVREIRAFDHDVYHVHTAFRSPGRLDQAELGERKADVYRSRYDNFRTGLSIVVKAIDASCGQDLDGVTFAFVCVDKGSSRAAIFDLLIAKGIPFIDVGMGLSRQNGSIGGLVRATYFPPEDARELVAKGLAPLVDTPDDIYRTTIQISELNALNAALAMIRFKQLRGFYYHDAPPPHLLFDISDLTIVGGPELNEN